MSALTGVRLLSLALNIPGPAAVACLVGLGAQALKIEPPAGDPLAAACPGWYRELHTGVEVRRLDLKSSPGQAELERLLAECDLLLTASRPASLARLGLAWADLAGRYPRLLQVAITGYPPPDEERAGHDLTYQAAAGLLEPPRLPLTALADMAGAERAVSAALALLLGRERAPETSERYAEVALAEAAAAFARPLAHGLTAPGGLLAGRLPSYNIYPAADGWLALAALEPHFVARLAGALGLAQVSSEALAAAFARRPAAEWERWAAGHDLPLAAVQKVNQDDG
ncbi:MAG: CoA transferase [Candidatus Promineifilaceae bacterium]